MDKLGGVLFRPKQQAIILSDPRICTNSYVFYRAKILNIKLIFLPTHSPKLTPIEQVWRAMKKKISSIDFKCMEKLIKKLKNPYYAEVERKTYTGNWTNKFININKS